VRQRRVGPAGGSVARGSGTSPCREVGLASRFDKSEIVGNRGVGNLRLIRVFTFHLLDSLNNNNQNTNMPHMTSDSNRNKDCLPKPQMGEGEFGEVGLAWGRDGC